MIRFTADDFGLSLAINEAVERAHVDGVLHAASLMVAGPAAADAVARARRLPTLHLGLHLVVIEGQATLPAHQIPALVDRSGWFDSNQLRRGLTYAVNPAARAQLAAEIEAQYAAFIATGLPLHHADAHKHMHLHPTIGRLMIAAGRRHGLARIRIPAEPPAIMAACGAKPTLAARTLYQWTKILRHQAHQAGLQTDDQVFGLAWSGHITADRLLRLRPHIPPGTTEIYTHPALTRDATIAALMPTYQHATELAALCDPRVIEAYRRRSHPPDLGL